MINFSRVATESELEDHRRVTLELLREIQIEEPQKSEHQDDLSPDLLSYLKLIHDTPGMIATQRDKLAGISIKKGSLQRERLKELGLIEEFETVGKKGRKAIDVRLTANAGRYLH